MSDTAPLSFADQTAEAVPLHVVGEADFDAWCEAQPASVAAWARRLGFSGALGQTHLLPQGGDEAESKG